MLHRAEGNLAPALRKRRTKIAKGDLRVGGSCFRAGRRAKQPCQGPTNSFNFCSNPTQVKVEPWKQALVNPKTKEQVWEPFRAGAGWCPVGTLHFTGICLIRILLCHHFLRCIAVAFILHGKLCQEALAAFLTNRSNQKSVSPALLGCSGEAGPSGVQSSFFFLFVHSIKLCFCVRARCPLNYKEMWSCSHAKSLSFFIKKRAGTVQTEVK